MESIKKLIAYSYRIKHCHSQGRKLGWEVTDNWALLENMPRILRQRLAHQLA